nr:MULTISPECIES: hypothetical protein [unclassified Rhodococcus (in: high G+C Gram-positive bacteria)]
MERTHDRLRESGPEFHAGRGVTGLELHGTTLRRTSGAIGNERLSRSAANSASNLFASAIFAISIEDAMVDCCGSTAEA